MQHNQCFQKKHTNNVCQLNNKQCLVNTAQRCLLIQHIQLQYSSWHCVKIQQLALCENTAAGTVWKYSSWHCMKIQQLALCEYTRHINNNKVTQCGGTSHIQLTTDYCPVFCPVYWLLTTDYWLLTADYWRLPPARCTDYWLLTTDYWLLTTDYWPLPTVLTTNGWLLTTVSCPVHCTDYCLLSRALQTTDY